MLSAFKPQTTAQTERFPTLPDPWEMPLPKTTGVHILPRVLLDPAHELSGAPMLATLMPEGIPDALQLAAPDFSVESAIAILLGDELKLADDVDEHLRDEIAEEIALLAASEAEVAMA